MYIIIRRGAARSCTVDDRTSDSFPYSNLAAIQANVAIERAEVADAPAILTLQKRAYQSEAALYQDDVLPPLVQTVEEMQRDLRAQVVLKATLADQIVGSVRARQQGTTCLIGRLIVEPGLQNRGLGTRLLQAIEEVFDGAERFELFTGHKSERNLTFYQKRGYTRFKTVQVHEGLALVYLEKRRAV
jgi:N-acetylglutamate synthase-like GNAT family acetyltransferase